MISVCSAARAAVSATAARPTSEVAAVTWDQVTDRIALCLVTVKETWSVVTGPLLWR